MTHKSFKLGDWNVYPDSKSVSCGDATRQLEPRAMDVLVYLCGRHNEIVSAERLLEACWGTTLFGDNPVHKIITQLRKALGDSSAEPRYIETIRKRGYRVLAPVQYEEDALAGSWVHDSPFRGLQAFEEKHAAIFFGRKLASSQLLQLIHKQAEAGCALTLVLGPSGSGKTSLVRAGVLPQLGASCNIHFDLADTGEVDLLRALGSVLLDCEVEQTLLFDKESAESLGQRLLSDPAGIADHLSRMLRGQEIALFVDRFETLFRMPNIGDAERTTFIDVLERLASGKGVHVILACRNDFYPYLVNYEPLMRLKHRGAHFDLNPPNQAEIAQIVRQPAQAAQLRFDTDPASGIPLDDVLCAEAQARPDILPLLQYCLQELYRQRLEDGTLSFAVFQALGGIEGALGSRAEQVTAAMGQAEMAALPRVLSQLVSVSEDELAITSRHLPWSALSDPAELELVKRLVEARLFVSDLSAGVPTFGVAHDALLRRWPRVVAWIENHRNALRLRTRISAQAERWQESGRDRDFLLPRGTQTNQARDLLHAPGFQVGALEKEFIDASLQYAKRGERRRLAVLVVVATLAVLASVLGLFARASQREAEKNRLEAEGLMSYMLDEFTAKLRPLGRLDLLDSVGNRALTYLSGAKQDEGDVVALTQRAKTLQVLAEVKVARADPDGATRALLAARQLLNKVAQKGAADKSLLKAQGTNAFWLGQIQLDQRNWGAAERYFKEYLSFSDALVKMDASDPDGWMEQAYAHSNLGTVAMKRGEIPRAADEARKSIELKTKALERKPGDQELSVGLANSLSWLASAEEKLGRQEEAMQLYRREAGLMKTLHEAAPGNALWTQRYAFSLWHQAYVQFDLDQLDEARLNFQAAETLLQSIIKQDPSNRSWQAALYTVQLKLVDLLPASAASRLAALQSLQEKLTDLIGLEPKKLNLQRLRASAYARRARVLWDIGRHSEAHRELAFATEQLQSMQKASPSDQEIRKSLITALLLQVEFENLEHSESHVHNTCETLRSLLNSQALPDQRFYKRNTQARISFCAATDRANTQNSKVVQP